MQAFFASLFGYFLSPVGLAVLAALDASMLFFLPFAVDAAVVILTARDPVRGFLHAPLAAAGSVAGAALTYWMGRRGGEAGLGRFVAPRRLERVRERVRKGGAVAMALPALLPPPFPLTPFVLVCGALSVSRTRFFVTLGLARLLRFGVEASLAALYGPRILNWMQSDAFRFVVIGLAIAAVIGTGVTLWKLFSGARGAASGALPSEP